MAEARKEGAHEGMDAGRPLEDRAGPVGAAMGKETILSRLDAGCFREHPIVRLPFQE